MADKVPPHGASHFDTHRLRRQAVRGRGEIGSVQAEVDRLLTTTPEDGRPDPRLISADDVARGFGLPLDQVSRIAQVVRDTRADFETKGGNQRIHMARGRLLSVLKSATPHVPSDVRQEILRRAISYWKAESPIDLHRSPSLRFGMAVKSETVKSETAKTTPRRRVALCVPLDTLVKGSPTGQQTPDARTQSIPDFSIYYSPDEDGRRRAEEQQAQDIRLDLMRERGRSLFGSTPGRTTNSRARVARFYEAAAGAPLDRPKLGITAPSAEGSVIRDEDEDEEDGEDEDEVSRKKKRSRTLERREK